MDFSEGYIAQMISEVCKKPVLLCCAHSKIPKKRPRKRTTKDRKTVRNDDLL